MKREELLKSREYWIEGIKLEVFEMVEKYRRSKGMNKTQLANHLKVSKGYFITEY